MEADLLLMETDEMFTVGRIGRSTAYFYRRTCIDAEQRPGNLVGKGLALCRTVDTGTEP